MRSLLVRLRSAADTTGFVIALIVVIVAGALWMNSPPPPPIDIGTTGLEETRMFLICVRAAAAGDETPQNCAVHALPNTPTMEQR